MEARRAFEAFHRDALEHIAGGVVERSRVNPLHPRNPQRRVPPQIPGDPGGILGAQPHSIPFHSPIGQFDEERREVGDAPAQGLLRALNLEGARVDEVLSRVLEVQDEDRLSRQLGVHAHEVLRAVEAGAMVTAARNEDEGARLSVLGLGEVTRHRDLHRQAVGVVP